MNSIKGKTALVTGGAKRIGREIALGLAKKGANIIVHYNTSKKDAEKTINEIKKLGVESWGIKADLSNIKHVKSLIERAIAKSGKIDFLVNNASVFNKSRLETFDEKEFLRTIQINALAPLILSKKFSLHTKKGSILNILDSRIKGIDIGHISYFLSKKMLRDITELLAVEMAPSITVNGLAIGFILDGKEKKPPLYNKIIKRIF